MQEAQGVLDFWFGSPGSPGYCQPRRAWFAKDPAFDEEIRQRFAGAVERAGAGELSGWQDTPAGALALVIVLDQFPRNMFRGDPRAFAHDARALAVAGTAVERGFDRELLPLQRLFLYLPFEHAEDLAMQRRSVALVETIAGGPEGEMHLDFARRHLAVIERFGRFPHRNAILGRESTPEEIEFLKQPGSSF